MSTSHDSQPSADQLRAAIVKSMTYVESDPETSLMYARKSAEWICTVVFRDAVGDPKKNRLDKLIELLAQNKHLPERIVNPLRTIQNYGNFASHAQEDQQGIDRAYIAPGIAALVQVSNWYFLEFLDADVPQDILALNNRFSQVRVEERDSIARTQRTIEASDEAGRLRGYQLQGVKFLLDNDSALLADEMGLGKTVQACIALRVVLRSHFGNRALIIVPASLVLNWERELAEWAPDLTVRRLYGSSGDRRATYLLPIHVLVATYEQVRIDALIAGPGVKFTIVLLDEAQRIKNPSSKAALACRMFVRDRSWALSGTPLENSVNDLLSLFLFVRPGLLNSGMPTSMISRSMSPYFLRRRKKDVLPEMPPIIVQDVPLELRGAQQRAYDELWLGRAAAIRGPGGAVTEATMLGVLTRLKQLCNLEPRTKTSVKREFLSLLLQQANSDGDRVLVFSQFVETLRFISDEIGQIPHGLYIGAQTRAHNQEELRAFTEEPGPRVLLVSLRAGGVGLNIQAASSVVMFDRWWNPAVENQAIHRAHRFGRTRQLHVYRLEVVDTIESRIADILRRKSAEFERVVEGAESASVSPLSRDELRKVLAVTEAESKREVTTSSIIIEEGQNPNG